MGGSDESSVPAATAVEAQGQGVAGDSIVLEEEIDPNYIPTQDEVREYAKWLGMELEDDRDLFWIAKEGLKAPLPDNWKPCKTVDTDEIYYFNFATGESTWDHPCDEYYRKLYDEEKKKKMTKDKAKHDKSKQQAKRDVNQLLGKNKKKKSRPAGKRPTLQPSAARVKGSQSPASSIFDRKPLPGIGRQPPHGMHARTREASKDCPDHPGERVPTSDRSPVRGHANSLVGHRLSQHISTSVDSVDGDHNSEVYQTMCEDSDPTYSASEKELLQQHEGGDTSNVANDVRDARLDHEAALKKRRQKNAEEIVALERAHHITREKLEEDHQGHLASQERRWEVSSRAQAESSRQSMQRELKQMRANHSRDIEEMEDGLVSAKARLKKATTQAEEAQRITESDERELESTLIGLRRRIVEEEELLREAQEAVRKKREAEPAEGDHEVGSKLARVVVQLEDERKHVVDLEGQLKEAKNACNRVAEADACYENCDDNKVVALEGELKLILQENEILKKDAARSGTSENSCRREDGPTPGDETKGHGRAKVHDMHKALEEAETTVVKLQKDNRLVEQRATDAVAARMKAEEKATVIEIENNQLSQQVVDLRKQNENTAGALESSLVGVRNLEESHSRKSRVQEAELAHFDAGVIQGQGETAAAVLNETEQLQVNLETSRNRMTFLSDEVHQLKEHGARLRDDLHAARLADRDGHLRIAEMTGSLETAAHEKALSAATIEQLRLENMRLKQDLDDLRSATVRGDTEAIAVNFVDDVKVLEVQLARTREEREILNAEVGRMKAQLTGSEGARRATQATLETSQSSHRDQAESLQEKIKTLRTEVLARNSREESLNNLVKSLQEKAAAETRASKPQHQHVDRRMVENACQTEEVGLEEVVTADLERAVAAADAAATKALDLTAENSALASRVERGEQQVKILHSHLETARSELADIRSDAAEFQLNTERNVSMMVPQEMLSAARVAEREAVEKLAKANAGRAEAEKSSSQACDDRAIMDKTLREALNAQKAQHEELVDARDKLSAFLTKDHRHAAIQTAADERCNKVEQELLQSQKKLHQATADFASAEDLAKVLQQQLGIADIRVKSMETDVRRTEDLASARQRESVRVCKHEQMTLQELRQVRGSILGANKDRQPAISAPNEVERHLAEAETDEVKASHEYSSGRHRGEVSKERPTQTDAVPGESRQSLQATAGNLAPPIPGSSGSGSAVMANDESPPSSGSVSDESGKGLANEILHHLEGEASRRRESRQAHEDKARRSWGKRLDDERRMLKLAKECVRHHQERVIERQQKLAHRQNRWRKQRQKARSLRSSDGRSHHAGGHRFLDDAKRELNRDILELNRFVKHLRSSKAWLQKRERQISDFETHAEADTPGLDARGDRDAGTKACSRLPSNPETSNVTATLCSLEEMQQELDNNISDSAAASFASDVGYCSRMDRAWEPRRARGHGCKQGKENVFSIPASMFSPGHQPLFPSSAAGKLWEQRPFIENNRGSRSGTPLGSTAPYDHLNVSNFSCRGNELFGTHALSREFSIDSVRQSSEAELQRWLHHQGLNPHTDVCASAARDKAGQVAKLTLQGKQAQSTVALHVDWLNTLKQEMGLLNFSPRESLHSRAPVPVVARSH